jgi:hypothetical protein
MRRCTTLVDGEIFWLTDQTTPSSDHSQRAHPFFEYPIHPMNSQEQQEFLQATAWLRPFTRWAAAFSVHWAGFLPAAIRNLPLKLIKRILASYQTRMHSGCKSH